MRKANRSNPKYDAPTDKNKKLYDYIYKYYTTSEIPCTVQCIADEFGKTKEYVHCFMSVHNLTRGRAKGDEYEFRDYVIKTLDEIGYKRCEIASWFGVSNNKITWLLGKRKGE